MCVGYFLVLLDVTIVNVALPAIGSRFRADVAGMQWVVDGYAIALAALMLAAGAVGDSLGHKRVVVDGLLLFGVASLGCGLAPSIEVLAGFRVAQGVGAALLLPGTLALITRAFPDPRERARAIGLWAGLGSVALPAGPLLGGGLVQALGWRAVFYVNVPIVVVAGGVAAAVVPEPPMWPRRHLDLPGALTGAALLSSVTLAFIEGGHLGLGSLMILAAAASLILLVAFIVVERRAAEPMLDLTLLANPRFSAPNVIAGIMNLVSLGLVFLLTLYLQREQERSPLAAGVAMLPLFAPLVLLAPIAGRLTARIGPRQPMLAGLCAAGAGIALLDFAEPGSSYLVLLPGFLLWGAGLGFLTPAVVAAALGALPDDRAGLASAVNNTARQSGGAIGIAAFGALAGQPGSRHFILGLHLAALIGVGFFLAAVLLTLRLIPR